MKRHVEKLKSVGQTSKWMEFLIRRHNADVAPFDDWEFYDFYVYVRQLPYIDDGDDEQLSRPKYTLPLPQATGGKILKFPGKEAETADFRDCDDKAIIIGCWLYRQGIPFRIIACSYKAKDEIHHCILQTQNPRMFVDATYPDEDDFPPTKDYYNITPLSGWITNRDVKPAVTKELVRNGERMVAGRKAARAKGYYG